jgi:RNA polymerase sigma-70 factor (ECF subfamily)
VYEPDPATVRAAADGDLAAFEELVRAYQAQVWRFLRHLLGDPTLAEDVTQETFLRVFQRLQTFGYRSRFSTWVFQVARNAGVDALRSRVRQERVAARVPRPGSVAGADSGADVVAALGTLSVKLRESLLLVEVLGLRYREVAGVLGVPEGTVKSRVSQARQRVAASLADGDAVDDRRWAPSGRADR